MAKGRQTRDRQKRKKQEQRRRQRRKQAPAKELTPKLAEKIDDVYKLIERRRFLEAEQKLDRLVKRYSRYPGVLHAQVYLYQETKNHESCSQAARRLIKLTPRDPDARLMYAQQSIFCGRLGIALASYQQFLRRWSEHANVEKARKAVDLLQPECESKIEGMGFGDELAAKSGLDLLVMHDEVLECMQNGRFDGAVEKCLELLKLAPNCVSARNNLALSYFQSGQIDKAVHVAEETCALAPENRFAEATLGKLQFLNGQEDEANAIANRIVVNPPTEQDPLAAAIELLSFLGRDEDVIVVSEAAKLADVDPRSWAMILHHLAVAQVRLGDEQAARKSWKKCLKAMPTHLEARANLEDLDAGEGHAPWAEPITKWIPLAVCDKMLGRESAPGNRDNLNLVKDYPAIASLIPALLDRGDPMGRELAMKLAQADGSPPMLDALQEFAFGERGPDRLRLDALYALNTNGRLDPGPHRMFNRGKWTEIKLFTAEIYSEPEECPPWQQELSERGSEALERGDYAVAEKAFQKILDRDPECCSAAYNICVVWIERDGRAGQRRAKAKMEEIHKQSPDYHFAPIALAQFAALEGDFDRASQLLQPLLQATRLHISEATALFATQVQIAVKRREFEAAEESFSLLVQIAGDDNPSVHKVRRMIDMAKSRRGLSRLLSGS